MNYEGSELNGLRFATNYYRWLLNEFRPALGEVVLEVGAGTGTFSEFLLSAGIQRLICLEPAQNLIPDLQQRAAGKPVELLVGTLENSPALICAETMDTVVCVNVIEHIEDDLQALRTMYSLLKPGGHLCLFTPALPQIYGTLDESFGHCRRYTMGNLREQATAAKFDVVKLKYFNFPGVFTWFLMGRILRWRSWSATPVLVYDRVVIRLFSMLERWCPPPMGQSLLLIARKAKVG